MLVPAPPDLPLAADLGVLEVQPVALHGPAEVGALEAAEEAGAAHAPVGEGGREVRGAIGCG